MLFIIYRNIAGFIVDILEYFNIYIMNLTFTEDIQKKHICDIILFMLRFENSLSVFNRNQKGINNE